MSGASNDQITLEIIQSSVQAAADEALRAQRRFRGCVGPSDERLTVDRQVAIGCGGVTHKRLRLPGLMLWLSGPQEPLAYR